MRKMLLLALTTCLVLAACGEGPPPEEARKASREAAEKEQVIPPPVTLPGKVNNEGNLDVSFKAANADLDLELDNFYFDPTFVRAAPGSTVSVRLNNQGTDEHSFSVDTPAVEEVLKPGARKTVEFKLPDSGVVNFYCKFHRSQGMQGAFYFKVAGAAEGTSPGMSPGA